MVTRPLICASAKLGRFMPTSEWNRFRHLVLYTSYSPSEGRTHVICYPSAVGALRHFAVHWIHDRQLFDGIRLCDWCSVTALVTGLGGLKMTDMKMQDMFQADMELGHWVAGSMGHLGHLFSLGHRVPGSSLWPSVRPGFYFILKHRFVVYLMFVEYFSFSFCLVPALCTAVSIRSSILSCVLHKPRLKAFRKRELILALSLWDNWPAKEGRAYLTTDSTIAVKITCNASCITRQTLIF